MVIGSGRGDPASVAALIGPLTRARIALEADAEATRTAYTELRDGWTGRESTHQRRTAEALTAEVEAFAAEIRAVARALGDHLEGEATELAVLLATSAERLRALGLGPRPRM